MGVEGVGFDSEDVKPNYFKSHEFKAGEIVRASVIFRSAADVPGARVHFTQEGGYFLCKSLWENGKIKTSAVCCSTPYKGNEARWRVGAVLVLYETEKVKGDDGKTRDKIVKYEVAPWIFTDKVYVQIKNCHSELPLDAHDIKITCLPNKEYKTYNVTSCGNTFLKALKEEARKKIYEEADGLLEKIKKNIGHDLSIDDIKVAIGSDAEGTADAATDVTMGDVLDGI